MSDPIERRDVLDVLRMCYETERVDYTNGNEYINYDQAVHEVEQLPSAQPEIIRCEDCKHGVHAGCGNTYLCVVSPEDRLEHRYDFWCAYAERRTDD